MSLADVAVQRTATRLADGRELIYYDETPRVDRDTTDRRELPLVEHRSQIRYDVLTGEWVAIAGHRQTRTYRPPADACPLCPSSPGNASEIPAADYDVVVFENRFPSFVGHADAPIADPGLFDRRPGAGRCEVVCFTSDHQRTFTSLSPQRVRTVVEAQIDRTIELSALPGIAEISCFENRGTEIGVTLQHPHGQIYGYPYVTPRTAQKLSALDRHAQRTGGNLFDDLVTGELSDRSRVVAENDEWVAFVPFAARWPVEVQLFPRNRVPDLPSLSAGQRDLLPALHLDVLRRMQGLFDDTLPAITVWQQSPVRPARDDFALHLQIFSIRRAKGKLKHLAGSESGMGAWISDSTPEDTARRLREVER